MAIDHYNHFVAIVAGDNPEVLMSPYDKKIETEPTVVYRYADAGLLRDEYIKVYKSVVSGPNIPDGPFKEDAKDKLAILESQTPQEFYYDLTDEYEHDEKTGDAITKENPN
jgi:hypothetical protein